MVNIRLYYLFHFRKYTYLLLNTVLTYLQAIHICGYSQHVNFSLKNKIIFSSVAVLISNKPGIIILEDLIFAGIVPWRKYKFIIFSSRRVLHVQIEAVDNS